MGREWYLKQVKDEVKLKELVNKIEINPRKLTEYALNTDNPKGVNKALMFKRYLGYLSYCFSLYNDNQKVFKN